MKKKIIFALATGFFALATVFNMNILQDRSTGDVSLDAIAIMAQAQSETGGVDYTMGYVNNPQNCTVVEYVQNEYCFEVWVPYYGWKVVCEWTYNQELEFPGTSNYCTYTGGASGCTYSDCTKN